MIHRGTYHGKVLYLASMLSLFPREFDCDCLRVTLPVNEAHGNCVALKENSHSYGLTFALQIQCGTARRPVSCGLWTSLRINDPVLPSAERMVYVNIVLHGPGGTHCC